MKLRHSILVDYSREVNRARRRHAMKRQVAWFCVILAMVLLTRHH